MLIKQRRLLLFLYLLSPFSADVPVHRPTAHVFPADLKTLCPYTTFCKENASQPFPGTSKQEPCCQSCSCEPTCGLRNNCCFKHLDSYNVQETYKMICKSMAATKTSVDGITHYRMIYKCLYPPTSPEAKSLPEINITNFQPVYSEQTGFIYYHAIIALCNNVNDTVPFRKAIRCPYKEEFLADSDRFLLGLEPSTECFLQYLPPEGVNLKSERCEPDFIRKCNVTGEKKEKETFWAFCETFNATYMLNYQAYGNVYCFMCNHKLNANNNIGHTVQQNCKILEDNNKIPGGVRGSLTVLLLNDFESDSDRTKKNMDMSRGCPTNEIMVQSFTKSCRPLKCPLLKILVNDRCLFYSRRWIGGPFSIYLRLTPTVEDIKILRSFFDEMPEKDKNDEPAKWLKRKTMKRWKIFMFYHLSPNNGFIEFMVVKATYPLNSINPSYIEQTVKMALEETWQITQMNQTIDLRIDLNEYTSYTSFYKSRFDEMMQNTFPETLFKNDEKIYVPQALVIMETNRFTSKIKVLDETLKTPEGIFPAIRSMEIFITKVFFCKQVDLLPDEYEDNFRNIFFRVKNVTLYTFRRMNSIADKQVSPLDNFTLVKETVRVCLSEFQPEADVANSITCCTFEFFICLFSTAMVGVIKEV